MATINQVGNSLTGSTGSGAFVGDTSPTLVSPALGTPASGDLRNCAFSRGSFKATLSSNQTVTSGAATKVQANTENYDLRSWYDNATNYRYTPLVAGKYKCFLYIEAVTSVSNGAIRGYIYKNGASIARIFCLYVTASTLYSTAYTEIDMNGSTDYLEFYVLIDGVTVNAGSYFGGGLIE